MHNSDGIYGQGRRCSSSSPTSPSSSSGGWGLPPCAASQRELLQPGQAGGYVPQRVLGQVHGVKVQGDQPAGPWAGLNQYVHAKMSNMCWNPSSIEIIRSCVIMLDVPGTMDGDVALLVMLKSLLVQAWMTP